MAHKIFIDANILLDFTLKREFYPVSRQVMELALNGEIVLFTSPAIVHIIAYWLTKSYGKQKAKELIIALLEYVTVIDADHATTLNALYSKIDDIEDAIQYFTALHHQVEIFLTRDKKLLKSALAGLLIYTPEHFLNKVLR